MRLKKEEINPAIAILDGVDLERGSIASIFLKND
jgi:hypothetical protein